MVFFKEGYARNMALLLIGAILIIFILLVAFIYLVTQIISGLSGEDIKMLGEWLGGVLRFKALFCT